MISEFTNTNKSNHYMQDREKHLLHRDVQDALELIGGHWRGAIMASLCGHPKRFLELKKDLSPITSRVLIKELRYLEQNKLVIAVRGGNAKNAVCYTHSEHGSSCAPVILQLREWAVKHREVMLETFKTDNKSAKTGSDPLDQ
jgi:DNA-binding HxlR family transcriptional regulator